MVFSFDEDFETGSNKFLKLLNRTFHKCFKKVRVRTGNIRPAGDDVIQSKLKAQKELKTFLKTNKCKIAEKDTLIELKIIEDELSKETADKNAKYVKDILNNVETEDGKFYHNGFWKIKQKLIPVAIDPPMAKHDRSGNMITAPSALKQLYIETYQERLKQIEMKEDYLDVFCLKTKL